jgi:UDP-N-acetylglucosamine 3-dehydrogenase
MIRLGVIGLDHPHATGNHFPALEYIQDRVRVAAIAHPDLEKARPWLDLFQAKYFSDRTSLLADPEIDAVLITSRNCDHAADAIAAAGAGKDIFCDKPIATSVTDARAIAKAVAAKKVRFMTTFPVRFNTSVRQVKQAIDAGELGEIKAIMATNHGCMYEPGEPAWVRDPKQNGGGCLIDHTVHIADIIRWLTGAEFAVVKAETSRAFRPIEAEDMAVMHGRMENGTLYQIDASWSRRGRHPMWGDVTFRIVGTRGTAGLDLYNNQRIEIYDEGITFKYPNYLCREHGEIFLDYAAGREQGKPTLGANEIDGLRTIELVFAAYESAQANQEVEIKKN